MTTDTASGHWTAKKSAVSPLSLQHDNEKKCLSQFWLCFISVMVLEFIQLTCCES